MSAKQLGQAIGWLAIVVMVVAFVLGGFVVPGMHGDRVDMDQATADAIGVPKAPDPNFPGGLNGQAVGEKLDANRDLQKQIWLEMAEAAKRGEDPLSREVASELRDKLKRRGNTIKKNPKPDRKSTV